MKYNLHVTFSLYYNIIGLYFLHNKGGGIKYLDSALNLTPFPLMCKYIAEENG